MRFSEQRSDVFNLTEGEDYLLVGEFKEGGGGDHIQVGVLPLFRLTIHLSVCLSICLV